MRLTFKHLDNPKLGLIIFPALLIGGYFWITHPKTEEKPNIAYKPQTSMVEVDGNQLRLALSDSCSLKGATLKCSPKIMKQLLKGVDSTAVKKINNNSITFTKNGSYINIPASIIANMIDLHLIYNDTQQ